MKHGNEASKNRDDDKQTCYETRSKIRINFHYARLAYSGLYGDLALDHVEWRKGIRVADPK